MADLVLIYPYVHRENPRRNLWLFPPLGQGFIASYLQSKGFTVRLLDCTFKGTDWAVEEAIRENPSAIGVYCMVTMREDAEYIGQQLREKLGNSVPLIAGGPMPSGNPKLFLPLFDFVMQGEGELVWERLLERLQANQPYKNIESLCYKDEQGKVVQNPRLPLMPKDLLEQVPMPDRSQFDHQGYLPYWEKHFGYKQTTVFTARGCPYGCEYCDQPIFGATYREHTVEQVMTDIERALADGYDRIWFADDIFMLNWQRSLKICDEILARGLKFKWDCLGRVDVNPKVFTKMAEAGCDRVFFGVESGSMRVLKQMGKKFTPEKVHQAIHAAQQVGIKPAAFFQIGYPGETTAEMLDTLRFIPTLPLDYLSFTITYPLPGTALFDRVVSEGKLTETEADERPEWKRAGHNVLTYKADHSQVKLRTAIYAGRARFLAEKHLGVVGKTLGPLITQAATVTLQRLS